MGTNQPTSNAGKIRSVLDKHPFASNGEIRELVGRQDHYSNDARRIDFLPIEYISTVRRKYLNLQKKNYCANKGRLGETVMIVRWESVVNGEIKEKQ